MDIEVSILLPGMHFGDLEGAIDPRELSIDFGSTDIRMLTTRMNELKDLLVDLLRLEQPDTNTWEGRRNEFLENIRRIHESISKGDESKDIDKPEFRDNAYYWGTDGPYCTCCFDQSQKKIHLLEKDNTYGKISLCCPACKTEASIKETYPVDLSGFRRRPGGGF